MCFVCLFFILTFRDQKVTTTEKRTNMWGLEACLFLSGSQLFLECCSHTTVHFLLNFKPAFWFQMSPRLMFSLKNEMNRQKQLRAQIQWKWTLPGAFTQLEVDEGILLGIRSSSRRAPTSLVIFLSPTPQCTPLPLYGRKRSRHTKKGLNTYRHGKYFLCLLLGPDNLQERKST